MVAGSNGQTPSARAIKTRKGSRNPLTISMPPSTATKAPPDWARALASPLQSQTLGCGAAAGTV
jgi:hypothetical protein